MLLRSCGKEVAFDVVLVFSCGIHQASKSTGVFLDLLSCLSFLGLYTPVPIFVYDFGHLLMRDEAGTSGLE